MKKKEWIRGANPYLPLWEHIPDGEPRVFSYQGESRIYIYGSHDTMKTEYCGMDYVVWSAPVTDLTEWKYHGVCYQAMGNSPLYAPDVVQKGDTYYLYAAEERGSQIYVARSDFPWGPFRDPILTDLKFDPGVLVDEDGRTYAYWGFCSSHCAELNEDMATIKEGTLRDHPIGHCRAIWADPNDGHLDLKDAFFEASSPRKVFGKYVYIYSKRSGIPQPELGVYEDCNGFLSYKWSDRPLEGYRGGGDISFNGGEILTDERGHGSMTYRWGNNHGSVMEVNGKWYVFYHRQTGRDEYSRQAMLEPIDAAIGKDGSIFLGKISYRDGEPISSVPVEMTSQGAHVNGLDARKWISAGYACHLYGGAEQAYIVRTDERAENVSTPVVNISNDTSVGFRYIQFGKNSPKTVTAVGQICGKHPVTISIRLDQRDGKEIARMQASFGAGEWTAPVSAGIIGKHAIYFLFNSQDEGEIARFDRFTFSDSEN